MPRRPGELSVRPQLVAPRRPRVPGGEEEEPRIPAEPEVPIPPEQEEALLARYEAWKAQWNGSLPEFLVFEFLVVEKKQVPNVDFYFQHPVFGGRTRFGGYILDYYFPNRLEGWRVMGERWHLEQPEDRARDAIMKAQLASQGMKIIDLWESDIMERRDFILNLAWERGVGVISRAPS